MVLNNNIIEIEDFSFEYPTSKNIFTLKNINLSIKAGEFVAVCGLSGSGKTTLLRQLKPILASYGKRSGNILFKGRNINELSQREEASEIGFVQQKPENQVVTDKVWHELAFGLESLGYSTRDIRLKVGEMASYFGIEDWFYKSVNELSNGQLQLLNLASIMTMQPEILILDEPTSQLDPIAASNFIDTLKKINMDLGTTIFLSEHRLNEVIPISDKVLLLDDGKVVFFDVPEKLGHYFQTNEDPMIKSMPVPMKIFSQIENVKNVPLTINEGRTLVNKLIKKENSEENLEIQNNDSNKVSDTVIEVNEVYFRYEKHSNDILKGINLEVKEGDIYSILGGNGAGKSTLLKLISRIYPPMRGNLKISGKNLSEISTKELFDENLAHLPQNPQDLFLKKTVKEELEDVIGKRKLNLEDEYNINKIMDLVNISHLVNSHPYDLSGGEQQRLALAKILLLNPKIILMDEPTKGMDGYFKDEFKDILDNLKSRGVTILIVTHDVEFAAEVSDKCALLFQGEFISKGSSREFFKGNYFYSTASNKIFRQRVENVITVDDAIKILRSRG